MAITYDNKSQNTSSSERVSTNLSHTTSGTDRGLLVFVGNADIGNHTVSSVTYNGVSMTQEATRNYNGGGGNSRVTMFSLIAPASGSNTVAINWSGSSVTSWVVAISYTDCNQSDLVEASASTTASSNSPSVSVTSITDNAVIVAGYNFVGGDGDPSTPGDTERWDLATGGSTGDDTTSAGGELLQVTAGAGTVNMTTNANDRWVMVGGAIKPLPIPPPVATVKAMPIFF